jgi:hypothetical protein
MPKTTAKTAIDNRRSAFQLFSQLDLAGQAAVLYHLCKITLEDILERGDVPADDAQWDACMDVINLLPGHYQRQLQVDANAMLAWPVHKPVRPMLRVLRGGKP